MKRSDLNHLRRLVAWRHQSRHLGGAFNPSPTGVRRGTQGFRPAASAAQARPSSGLGVMGLPVVRLVPRRQSPTVPAATPCPATCLAYL